MATPQFQHKNSLRGNYSGRADPFSTPISTHDYGQLGRNIYRFTAKKEGKKQSLIEVVHRQQK
jgi:hypothetical protein